MSKSVTLQSIFDTAIKMWIENDPRGEKEVKQYLQSLQKDFENLSKHEQEYYDREHLNHPYHDSTIYYGDESTKIKKIAIWIDVEWPEFLLIHELNKTLETPIDAIIGHHPEWKALLGIAKLQKWVAPFVWHNTWVPINIAEKIEFSRVTEVEQRFSPMNHNRALPFARMLDIPYVWIHTPADNCVHTFLERLISENKDKLNNLQDIIDILMQEPEMQIAKKNGSWPAIWNGDKNSRCGKIVVTGITGWTESSKNIYEEYKNAGVGTILEMHMSADHLAEAKKHNLNVIMTDHMASDSLWMNLIFDEVEKMWVEIIDFSWFTRCSRNA